MRGVQGYEYTLPVACWCIGGTILQCLCQSQYSLISYGAPDSFALWRLVWWHEEKFGDENYLICILLVFPPVVCPSFILVSILGALVSCFSVLQETRQLNTGLGWMEQLSNEKRFVGKCASLITVIISRLVKWNLFLTAKW